MFLSFQTNYKNEEGKNYMASLSVQCYYSLDNSTWIPLPQPFLSNSDNSSTIVSEIGVGTVFHFKSVITMTGIWGTVFLTECFVDESGQYILRKSRAFNDYTVTPNQTITNIYNNMVSGDVRCSYSLSCKKSREVSIGFSTVDSGFNNFAVRRYFGGYSTGLTTANKVIVYERELVNVFGFYNSSTSKSLRFQNNFTKNSFIQNYTAGSVSKIGFDPTYTSVPDDLLEYGQGTDRTNIIYDFNVSKAPYLKPVITVLQYDGVSSISIQITQDNDSLKKPIRNGLYVVQVKKLVDDTWYTMFSYSSSVIEVYNTTLPFTYDKIKNSSSGNVCFRTRTESNDGIQTSDWSDTFEWVDIR